MKVEVDLVVEDTITPVSSSFAGGKTISLSGKGFDSVNLDNNSVKVCGFPSRIIEATSTSLDFEIPQIQSSILMSTYHSNAVP